jgi:hypothetical protein
MSYEQAPVVRLAASGLTVANFSSAHPFHFDTGEVLPACSEARCKALSLVENHREEPHPRGWVDVHIEYLMSEEVLRELYLVCNDPKHDVVLVPLPVLLAAKGRFRKVRGCRIEDRVKKLVSSTKFCV